MKTKSDIKTDIKSALQIEEEFRADGNSLDTEGRDLVCCCPFHSESTASCRVHPDKQYFKCFGCGASGDVLDYLAYRLFKKKDISAKDFIDVLKEGCARAGIEFPSSEKKPLSKISDLPEDKGKRFYRATNHVSDDDEGPPISDAPNDNDIPEDAPIAVTVAKKTEKKVTIYSTIQKARDCCDYMARCGKEKITQWNEYLNPATGIIDAYTVRFESLTEKRKNGKPKKRFIQISPCEGGFWFKAPEGKQPLFNRDLIAESNSVVLVEGEKCAKFITDLGFTGTCALASSTKDPTNIDWNPLAGKQVIQWPDALDGGAEFMRTIQAELEKLEPMPEILVVQVDEYKVSKGDDVVDLWEKTAGTRDDKNAAVFEVLSNAQGVGSLAEMERNIAEAIAGRRKNIPFPWSQLTQLTRALVPGAVLIFAGGEGSTKSFMLLQCVRYWMNQGFKNRVLMCEDGDAYHLQRLLAQVSGTGWITNEEEQFARPEETLRIVSEFKLQLVALQRCIDSPKGMDDLTADKLLAWVEASAKAGNRIISIDPITAMEKGNFGFNDDRKFMMGAKQIVEKYKASLVLVTHPRQVKKQDGKTIVGIGDIAGGLAYTRFAQCVIFLKAIKDNFVARYGEVTPFNRYVEVFKARNSFGRGKYVALKFHSESLTTTEIGEFELTDDHKE